MSTAVYQKKWPGHSHVFQPLHRAMEPFVGNSQKTTQRFKLGVFAAAALCAALTPNVLFPQNAAPTPARSAVSRPAGTIKSIGGNTIVLTTDAGSEITVIVQDSAHVIAVTPGQKDLQSAQKIQFTDLRPGDRILVRGTAQTDGKAILASSVLAMKRSDVVEKQAHDREDWRKNGIGGLVRAVDPTSETVTVGVTTATGAKDVVIRVAKSTVFRRYAPDSVQFDKAIVSSMEQIKPGDQLRARGMQGPANGEFSASEIVTGAFRNIAGTISSIDAASGSLQVQDLAAKQSVQIKITPESQVRKLLSPVAQRIAMRLKGNASQDHSSQKNAAENTSNGDSSPRVPGQPGAGAAGKPGERVTGLGRNGGAPDLQQMILRMPPSTLADFQKGDAVMIVATQGSRQTLATAIILLGGVEPILSSSPKGEASSLLSPWSLSTGGGDSAP